MRIATWNLNSVKARLPRLLSWIEDRQPDVLLVQETKATEQSWPAAELTARVMSQRTWAPAGGTGSRSSPGSG